MTEAPTPAPTPSPTPAPTPSPAPTPAPSPGGDWYTPFNLADDQREFIAAKRFDGVGDLVKNAMDFERLARERNVIPAPDADPAKLFDWEGWEKLGYVKDRAAYKVDPVKPPDGKSYDADLEKVFLDAAHAARVPVAQAKAIRDAMAVAGFKMQDDALNAGALALQETEAALKREWGSDYAVNKERARQAAHFLGLGAEDASALEKITAAPGLAKMFARIGALLGEDTIKGGAAGGDGGRGLTPDGAAAEMKRLEVDQSFMEALRDPMHPRHAEVTARREELVKLKYRDK